MSAPASTASTSLRCTVHPARPALDLCPVCARPRCGADATADGAAGCGVCRARPAQPAVQVASERDRQRAGLVGAALAASVVGLVGGFVSSQYVGAGAFAILAPFIVGLLCGAVATRAARTDGRGRFGLVVRVVAVGYAVLGAAYAFRFVPGSESAFTPAGRVLPPYAAAAAGAWLWTIPPRRRRATGADREGEDVE